MPTRIFALAFLMFCALLAGCGSQDDPQAALEAAVQQLQDNLEAKQNSAVLDQLHPQFSAQGEFDREWAQRTISGASLASAACFSFCNSFGASLR